ncbi:MAG TPA: hypothetical protein PLY70_18415 [Saprospiraceae bacterium]|nr:hypothetical protein [Saprospiraceae bacterium]HPN69677.1 hypothetical protein [Saprospiraceae bacterium]
MKKIGVFVVFAMLVGFPAISWYYLRGGVNYRKEAFAEMESKGPFDTSGLNKSLLDKIQNHVTIVDLNGSNETAKELLSQFDKVDEFLFLSNHQVDSLKLAPEALEAYKKTYGNVDYVLVDLEGNVRSTYKDTSKDHKLLVKHVAILLPFVEKNNRLNNAQ